MPLTTAPVVAQVSRSARQAPLRRLLAGCRIVPFAADEAHAVGTLLARARTSDVVDAHVALVAEAADAAAILTSDADDLARLSSALPRPVAIVRV